MTKEEATDLLNNLIGMVEDNHKSDYDTALQMAIKALEQEPICPSHGIDCEDCPAYEPCDDAISRADAEALFRNARRKLNPSDYKTAYEFNTRDLMLLNAEQLIHLLPSVNPQPKTGHWINELLPLPLSDGSKECVRCSQCGLHYDVASYYCPNCGALMESEESCDNCKHNTESWESDACDGCCGSHSGFEPQESEVSDADSD